MQTHTKLIIAVIIGVLIGFVFSQWFLSDAVNSESSLAVRGGGGSIEVPESAVPITACIPNLGFRYADPATLPVGPIYILDGEEELLGIEYLLTEAELKGVAEGMHYMPAFGFGVAEVSLTFAPTGYDDISEPLYTLHLYRQAAKERKGVCVGYEIENGGVEENASAWQGESFSATSDVSQKDLSNLPVPIVIETVRGQASETFKVPISQVIVLNAFEKTWPNGCLGLPQPDEECTEALVEGYQVSVSADGREQTYRTDHAGLIIRAE